MKILSLFWGFILTIWNVNRLVSVEVPNESEGFILTIWNVNPDFSASTGVIETCFILTIWNVNFYNFLLRCYLMII
ncbi:TPA: hypothetical protein I9165_002926 [Clostridioides difficile]|nr:hypothetical protein [Clostridioides difficile]